MKQYLDLIQNILDNGVEKESGRENMPNTIGISNGIIKMDLRDGFPLLTTKKMAWKSIIYELLWFLRGESNIKYLVDNNVHIWDGDAYRWYLKHFELAKNKSIEKYGIGGLDKDFVPASIEEFIDTIKNYGNWLPLLKSSAAIDAFTEVKYKLGDLGKVYGYQWRNQNGVDQIKDCIEGLQKNPYSRYHIIDAWNKSDFVDMALPPCHLLYQFIVRPLSLDQRQNVFRERNNSLMLNFDSIERITKGLDECNIPKFYLDLNMYQRSCDTMLGVPFNIASMSLLLIIFGKASNMIPGVATWIGGDTHLYLDHIELAKDQMQRIPYKLPELKINKELKTLDDILNLNIDDFELIGYESHEKIKVELFTGYKKDDK